MQTFKKTSIEFNVRSFLEEKYSFRAEHVSAHLGRHNALRFA